MGVSQFDEQTPVFGAFSFTDGSGTFVQTVAGYSVGRFRIDSLFACSDDTIDTQMAITLSITSVPDFVVGVVTVPAGAGQGVVPLVDLLAALGYTPGGFVLPGGSQIQANAVVAVTTGKTVTLFACGGSL